MADSNVIKKAVFTAPRKVEVQSEPARRIGPREVRIRTLATGISRGTEMSIYRGAACFFHKTYDPRIALFLDDDRGAWRYPVEFGYENVGRVIETGVDADEVPLGATVITYQPHRSEVVIDLDSRDVLIGDMPPVLRLPDGVRVEHGLFAPLLGVAMNAILDGQLLLGERVAIYGAGVVGLLALQLCVKAGAAGVYVIEPIASRRHTAATLGASETFDPGASGDIARVLRDRTAGRGVDLALETSGSYAALREAIRAVGKDGRVVASSWYTGNAADLTLSEEFHLNRVRIISSQSAGINPLIGERWDKARRTRAVLELLGSLNLEGMISHRFPYANIQEAYRVVDEGADDVLQVVIEYETS